MPGFQMILTAIVGFLIQGTCVLLVAGTALVLSYYWILAVVGLTGRKQANPSPSGNHRTFLILIPAHNEERVLAKTIADLKGLDYPSDLYKVVVIADNCNDHTARIAREGGALCLERTDLKNQGKGQALSWGFSHLASEVFDAILVLDADCFIKPHALRVFGNYLDRGGMALQARNVASNPDDSSMSYAVAVGNLLENDFFYAPKSRLGLAVLLRGTGFVLAREILVSFPWHASSVTEDVEYSACLIQNRIPIQFIPEVEVRSKFPTYAAQLDVQRKRWAEGNLGFGKKNALKLIWKGFRAGNWRLVDAGWTFLILSKPLVFSSVWAALALSIVGLWLMPGRGSTALLWASLFLAGSMLAYLGLGVYRIGVNGHRIKLLCGTPYVVFKLCMIALQSLTGRGTEIWIRTPR
jgi:cellulose synthase/poly-beta-1,6-N-acetylglucosamine synthase-like glycosyltransferase